MNVYEVRRIRVTPTTNPHSFAMTLVNKRFNDGGVVTGFLAISDAEIEIVVKHVLL